MTARTRKYALLAALVLLPACSSTTYHVEMSRLNDSGLVSRTVRKADQPANKDKKVEEPTTTTFRGETPQDVGGAGSYQHHPDPMGSVSIYMERFGGNDDLHGQLREMSTAADALLDILIAWFQSELQDDPRWPKLKTFLHQDLRRDLKNVALYLWTGRNRGKVEGAGVRIVQYLIERGYFKATEIPAMSGLIQDALNEGDAGTDRFMKYLQRQVARRMGIKDNQAAPESLVFLSTLEAANTSLVHWYAGTDEGRARMARFQSLPEDERGDKPEYPDFEALHIEDMVGFELFASTRHVEVKFLAEGPPVKTNGTWEKDHQRLLWKRRIDRANTLPALCYAVWAAPDNAYQKKHLGRVALSGDELIGYVLARAALDPKDQRVWDALVDSLDGGAGTREKIVKLGEDVPVFSPLADPLASALAQED
ncbi:MAG: hypothetical protein OER86_03475 [Phycisphaerae bacterium]|nr:hypothetical protein [Phycisphaerae bacterium]